MNINNRINRFMNFFEEGLLTLTFIIMTIVSFIQVLARFVFSISLPWSEELLRALFVWSSCIGISYAFRKDSHLGIDIIYGNLPNSAKRVLTVIISILCIAFCVFVIYFSVNITATQFMTNQKTIAMRILIGYISISMPIGFTISIIRIIQSMILKLRMLKEVEEQ